MDVNQKKKRSQDRALRNTAGGVSYRTTPFSLQIEISEIQIKKSEVQIKKSEVQIKKKWNSN